MNTRISKILSVLATVAIVASSFVWALPVAASNPGDGSFAVQDFPATGTAGKYVLLAGSQVIDIAVGSDAKTIYVAEPAAATYIMKSTDGGQSFDTVTNNYGLTGTTPAGGGVPRAISVAPDDVNTVAVTDGTLVIITKDGGTTWSALPAPILGGGVITDIAVAPARSGTLLGREYIISIADPGAGVAAGDVQIIGNNATWTTVGVAGGGGARTAVATVSTAAFSTAGTYTVNYTDQGGAASVSGPVVIPAASAVGTTVAVPLTGGDTGMLDVTGVTVVSSGATIQATTTTTGNWSATQGNYTVNYIDQAGAASVSGTVTIPAGSIPGAVVAIPLTGGDTAVRDVTGVNLVTAATANDTFIINSLTPVVTFGTVTNGATAAFTDGAVPTGDSFTINAVGLPAMLFGTVTNGFTGTFTDGSAIGGNSLAGIMDFTSVVVTPNFLGDRCVVAVGTGLAAGSTSLLIINTATNTIVNNPAGVAVATGIVLLTGANAVTTNVGTGAFGIVTSSIALPTNFDPTTTSGRRAYVGIASTTTFTDNDVYRVESDSAKALGAVIAPVYTIAYNGTIDTGILFMGPRNGTDVKYSTTMTASSPTWTTTLKGPTSALAAASVIVRVASDYATSNTLFAGTLGLESGFNISSDAGVSFVQESLIDTGPAAVDIGTPSLSFASDAKSVLVYAKDTNVPAYIAIWKSAVPMTATSWSRIFAKPSTGTGSIKTSGTAIYFAEVAVPNGNIYVSQDSGVSFSTRNGPTGVTLKAYALRDAQTVYFVDTTGSLYKSTNGAFFFGTAVAGGMGANTAITLPKANQVILSGTGVTLSNDDGATFTAMTGGLPAGAKYAISADTNYATNNLIYTTDTNGAGLNIYRVKTDSTSNTFENMGFPQGGGPTILGITTRSGLLYATTDSLAVGVLRTLYPTDLVGNQNWSMVFNGMPGAIATGVSTTAGIIIYARNANKIYAFNDYLATTKPTLTAVDDNFANAVDPNTGYGMLVDLKIKPMGVGNGQVNKVDVEIADKNIGLTGTLFTTVPVSATLPTVTTAATSSGAPFQSDHSYLWRIRAAGVTSTQLIDSPWSDTRTINIQAGGRVQQSQAGVILTGPQGGATNVDPTLVGFSWAPVQGATEYQIIIATDAALTKTIGGTPAKVTTTSYQAAGMSFSTTYFWAVMATKPTVSQQSIGTFTTMAKPVPPASVPAGGQPPITVVVPPAAAAETPAYIWAVIAIGAILVIAVIILIVRTRRVP